LQQVYIIIYNKLKNKSIDKNIIFQIAVKIVNNTARLDRIVPTLLVFRIYLKIAEIDLPAATIIQQAAAIKLAIKEVQ
jgi:hypothetical protein